MTATPRRWAIAAGVVAGLAALLAVGLIATSDDGGAHAHSGVATHQRPRTTPRREAGTAVGTPSARDSKAKYGGLPSWLPKAKAPAGHIVTATPAHHRLAIEGDTVAVHLPGGRAMITAVGPDVPEQGKIPVPSTSPCRFLVTVAAVHGSIPVAPRTFTFLGEHGEVHGARVALRGGGSAPRRIAAGHPVTLVLSAVLPTGNGQLRWAPLPATPIVSWDFDVEID